MEANANNSLLLTIEDDAYVNSINFPNYQLSSTNYFHDKSCTDDDGNNKSASEDLEGSQSFLLQNMITPTSPEANFAVPSTLFNPIEKENSEPVHSKNLRSIGKVISRRDIVLPDDISIGPWKSAEEGKNELNIWSNNLNIGGGRFALNWSGYNAANRDRGIQKNLRCHRSKKPIVSGELRRSVSLRCNCPVFIRLEQCIGGWIIVGGMFIHNHELVQNIGSSLAEASLRCIPPDLIELGDKLRRAGFTASKINQVLESECRRQGVEVSWNYQDVYNKFAPSGEERLFDATNFTEYSRKRQNDKDLYFDTTTDTDGCLEKVFWVLEGGLDLWAEGYESNCVLFDTSYGTNRYFLKIGAFTTVNKYGKTVIIACSLLTNEDQESFEWLFKEFLKVFRTTPNVMFTDGDPGMANAICLVLPRTTIYYARFTFLKISRHTSNLYSVARVMILKLNGQNS